MSGSLPTGGGYAGAGWFRTGGSQFNAMSFLIRQIIAGKTFGALVKVLAVGGAGGVNPPGTVSVQPLVNQIDGLGNPVPHGTVYGMPWFRLQGGSSAIILDPVVGDIGAALICDRDISNVKATGAAANPGSWRQNDWADGVYFGAFLGAAPTEYIQFTGNGINIVSPGTVAITSPAVTANNDITAGFGGGDSVTLQNHTHAQGDDGHGDSEVETNKPTAGT